MTAKTRLARALIVALVTGLLALAGAAPLIQPGTGSPSLMSADW